MGNDQTLHRGVSTPRRLDDADFCSRLEFLSRSWERESLSPMQLLSRAIDHGLQCDAKDPGQAAGDKVMELAVSRPIETTQEDLLGLAEHTAALADFVTWLLRPEGPWEHPKVTDCGGHPWYPESYLAPTGLRRVVLVDHWSDKRAEAESFDWRSLEAAIYGLPMTLVVVVLGASRDGRRHGPLSKGFIHPVSQQLRFRKRDQTDFGATWGPLFRENFKGEREDWIEQLTEDRVLEECLILHEVPAPEHSDKIRDLASSKLDRLAGTSELPEPQVSRCHDPLRKCPFNSTCPYFRMPSEGNGFISIATGPKLVTP
jgi:hypothetical protein